MTKYYHSGDSLDEEDLKAISERAQAVDISRSEESADQEGAATDTLGNEGGHAAGPGTEDKQQDAEMSEELSVSDQEAGPPSEETGPEGKGADFEINLEANTGADVGVDSDVSGHDEEDLEASEGLGTPDQEGSQSGPDTQAMSGEEEQPGDHPEQAGEADSPEMSGSADSSTGGSNGTDEAGTGTGGSPQDAEASDELGKQEQGEGHRGLLAWLFGIDSDDEENSDGQETQEAQGAGEADSEHKAQGEAQDRTKSGKRTQANGSEDAEQGKSRQGSVAGNNESGRSYEGVTEDKLPGGNAGEAGSDPPSGVNRAEERQPQGRGAKSPPKLSAKGDLRQHSEEKPKDPRQEKRDKERSDSLEESIIYWQGTNEIPVTLKETKDTLTEVMGLGSSFDVVFREMTFGGQKAALLCISGFAKDTILDEILKRLTYLTPENVTTDVLASFMNLYIPHIQVEKGQLLSESINKVLTGMSAIFIEGETQVILMDTRAYPARSPDEPSIERVVRGARDGFTETLLSNVALVRRRVRDPGLKYEMHQVGRRTRTDVCVAYIDDIVDKTQVKAVTEQIKSVDIDGIPLADKQLEEAIIGKGWNPYPLVRYSERPDIVASHLLEGRVVIFVDTSPSVMVLPTTFFDLCQHAEENRQTAFMGTYLRWVRFIGIFASMFLLPLWMLLVIHPELKPPMLEFIGPQKTAKIPLLAQFLIVELGVDLLRMAAVHTPTPLGSAMGLIAAILVGDIAVQTGLFVNEVVLYMAVASIGMFATPNYELGLANRIVRLVLLLVVAIFQVPGFVIGTTLLIVLLTTHRSYNSSYLWPFIPFNAKAMGEIILRQPVLNSKTRPSFNKTRDNTRMPHPDPRS